MSSPDRVNRLCSAALRHLVDAERLAGDSTHPSLDQAWHLAGFGPECALKATLASGRFDRALGHDVHDPDIMGWVLAVDPFPGAPRTGVPSLPGTRNWNPDSRYERTGTATDEEVEAILEHARVATLGPISALWAMGVLTGEVR